MMKHDQTIKDVVKHAGGPAAIQAELERHGQALTRDAIYKWQKTGIPDRYWPTIIFLTGFEPAEIYAANCLTRGVASVLEAAE